MIRLDENTFWFALADSDVLFYAIGLAANSGLDVQLSIAEAYPLQVQGPKSKDVIRDLFGEDVAGLHWYRFVQANLDGIPVVVTRTGWSSEVGYEVYLRDASRGDDLWERIMDAGRPYDIRPTGPVDIRRIEGGVLNWGCDMDQTNNPYQVGLERLVDLDSDADFASREALARIASTGVSRKLVGVQIDGEPLDMNPTKWPVASGGSTIGEVTSAVWSPRLKKNVGFAWVPVEHAADGTSLTVETADGTRAATVAPMPFIDPGKQIPRS
jgi:aminomethyltransferase